MRRFALFSLLLVVGCTRTAAAPADPGAATVVEVVDGDTVVVDIGGRQETLRLIGVDTPETVDPDQPPECFGAEASAHTKELLPVGTAVRLTRDVEARDRYDRLLVYLERAEDGLFVNLDLVAGGWSGSTVSGVSTPIRRRVSCRPPMSTTTVSPSTTSTTVAAPGSAGAAAVRAQPAASRNDRYRTRRTARLPRCGVQPGEAAVDWRQ